MAGASKLETAIYPPPTYRTGFDNVVFDVYTAVQAYLTEKPVVISDQADENAVPTTIETKTAVDCNVKMSRVIFWTHHLKAPSKKRDMSAWCSELSLWGLIKSGCVATRSSGDHPLTLTCLTATPDISALRES